MKFWPLLLGLLSLLSTGPSEAQAVTSVPDSVQVIPNSLTFYVFLNAYYGYGFPQPSTPDRAAFLYSHDRQNEFAVNNAYAAEDPVFRHIYEATPGFGLLPTLGLTLAFSRRT
ncbi:hypothetical protein [Hymenobacter radiodurans]|uniref:hypothetical protein n=1 Tax=Hymenobacter radiodurans TaxID=2496028 RepID=UPI00105873BF|nr:hypothetical protein [Hymenobacter radiodurans]